MNGNSNQQATSAEAPREGGETSRAARDSLLLAARMTIGDDPQPHEVRVRNLSRTGLMVELGHMTDPGTRVSLEMRGVGHVTGRVAWFAEGRMGVALDHPIDPAQARRPVVRRNGGLS